MEHNANHIIPSYRYLHSVAEVKLDGVAALGAVTQIFF